MEDNKEIAENKNSAVSSSNTSSSPTLTLEDRIKKAINNAKNLSNELYGTDEEEEFQLQELERIEEGFKTFNKKLASIEKNRWGYSPSGYMSKVLVSKHLNSLKNGLYAVYPIPCKQGQCPYGSSCIAYQNNIQPPYGEPCVLETNKIENLIIQYSLQFDLDSASTTDKIQIRELIQLDILMDRCQCLMSRDVDILQDVVVGITDNGETYTQPTVSKYFDAWERMSKRRQSLMEDMLATKKAKKGIKADNLSDEEIILKTIASDSNFMDVEERPPEFKKEEESLR